MEIDTQKVSAAGGKIRRIGDDAQAFLQRMSGPLKAGAQGNEGFTAIVALREAVDRLEFSTKDLATNSQSTGDKVTAAARNHETNDDDKSRAFKSLTPSGSR